MPGAGQHHLEGGLEGEHLLHYLSGRLGDLEGSEEVKAEVDLPLGEEVMGKEAEEDVHQGSDEGDKDPERHGAMAHLEGVVWAGGGDGAEADGRGDAEGLVAAHQAQDQADDPGEDAAVGVGHAPPGGAGSETARTEKYTRSGTGEARGEAGGPTREPG